MQLNENNTKTIAFNFKNKRIGIWGYGVTGAAAVAYFEQQHPERIIVFDEKPLSFNIQNMLAEKNITLYDNTTQQLFLDEADFILKSPGIPCINLAPNYKEKIISEFDIFASLWRGPIIAITGTVGKTTVTTLLDQLLHKATIISYAGGNIGTPMLSLLAAQTSEAYAVIELSSFHTELGIAVPPDLAIITNIHPNHLDRHISIENYRAAKLELIRRQKPYQKVLLPLSLAHYVDRSHSQQSYAWFSVQAPSHHERSFCREHDTWYYSENDYIVRERGHKKTIIGPKQPTSITFPENILIITAALDQQGIQISTTAWQGVAIPAHRLAPLVEHNGVTFYNDSKSTIPAATRAALQQLSPYKPILFLGGVSKGVDRKPFISELTGTITSVFCFGKEAEQLASWCKEYGIPVHADHTLEAAYQRYIKQHATAGDHVLFSPAGASYDLFNNYIERGECFVKLVQGTTRYSNVTD